MSASVSYNYTQHGLNQTMTLTVEETAYSVDNNTSDIKWTAAVTATGTSHAADAHLKAIVNGQTVYDKTEAAKTQGSVFPAAAGSVSGTLTVPHNEDGTKTISFSLIGYFYEHTDVTKDGTLKLTDIPREDKVKVKVSGSWKTAKAHVKVNGSWKVVKKIWMKVNGVWKESALK